MSRVFRARTKTKTTSVVGIEETLKNLDNVRDGIRNRILRQSLRKRGSVMSKRAKSLVTRRSGLTAKSIGVVTRTKKNGPIVVVGPRKHFVSIVDGRRHAPHKIAHLIEGGRREVKVKSGRIMANDQASPKQVFGTKAKAVTARPFMAPVMAHEQSVGVNLLARDIERGIRNEIKKYKARGKTIYAS